MLFMIFVPFWADQHMENSNNEKKEFLEYILYVEK